mgnify:FL=1
MSKTLLSYFVHIFTVTGVVFGFLALINAIEQNIPAVFFFLAIALFVDGIDGSLARIVDVKKNTPNINGEILDNIIDYLNYVFVPAFVIYWCNMVPEGLELISISIILIVSCYTFANNNIKTTDFYFSGFPALWNVIILYFYILESSSETNFYIIIAFAFLTFIPFKYVHPFRVIEFRKTSLSLLILWMLSTVVLLYFPESNQVIINISFILWCLSNLYFLSLTVFRSIRKEVI